MKKKNELLKLSSQLWDKSRSEYTEIFDDEDDYKDIMDYRQLHSKVVADLALAMYDKYYNNLFESDNNLFKESLYFGCLVHDTKKLTPKHNLAGEKFIKSYSNTIPNDLLDINLALTLIKYHTASKKRNDESYFIEIADLKNEIKVLLLFTRLSDKLSKLVVKSYYKPILHTDVDNVINKIVDRSPELLTASPSIAVTIDSISTSFKAKYCTNDN